MIDIAYEDLRTHKIAGLNKAGRPAKHGQQLSCMVQPDTLDFIKKLSQDLDIAQGEAVDLFAFFYGVKSSEKPEMPQLSEMIKRLKTIEKRIIPISAVFESPATEYRPGKTHETSQVASVKKNKTSKPNSAKGRQK